ILVFQRQPFLQAAGEIIRFRLESRIAHAIGLAAKDKSRLGTVNIYARGIWKGRKKAIHGLRTNRSRCIQLLPEVTGKVMDSLVHLLFCNFQHLRKVALKSSLHRTVPLNRFQLPCAKKNQGRRRQNYRQLKRQQQPALLVPISHLPIVALLWLPCRTSSEKR